MDTQTEAPKKRKRLQIDTSTDTGPDRSKSPAPPNEPPAATEPIETIDIALEHIEEDPGNVRKTFESKALEQLRRSMLTKGQLQPICVRPARAAGQIVPGRWVINWGHRRFRVAKKLEWRTIRAEVRDCSDSELRALQLAENDKHEQLKALERSAAHQDMARQGKTPAQIAAETDDSEAMVRDSLKLQNLLPQSKKAWAGGKLDYSSALEVAKMPAPVQGSFLAEVLQGTEDGEALSVRQIRDLRNRYFLLDLARAPFPVADAQLVPKAGACTACPTRTGAEPDMFEQAQTSADFCTNKLCHADKCKAFLAQQEKAGRTVLDEKTAMQIFNQHDTANDWFAYDADYVKATEKVPGSKKTFGQLVDQKDVALVVNPATGHLVEVIEKSALPKVKRDEDEKPKAKKDPEEVKKERDHAIRKRAAESARRALLEKVKSAKRDTAWMRVVVAAMVSTARSGPPKQICKWNELEVDDGAYGDAIIKHANGLPDNELCALLFEFALAERIEPHFHGKGHTEILQLACDSLDVDLKEIEKVERAEYDGTEKAKAQAKRAKAAGTGKNLFRKTA